MPFIVESKAGSNVVLYPQTTAADAMAKLVELRRAGARRSRFKIGTAGS